MANRWYMAAYSIDELARATGRAAREVRELIERGELPAVRQSGRWMVDHAELERSPLGASELSGPALREVEVPGEEPAVAAPGEVSTLIARLEARAVEIADLRRERDALGADLRAAKEELAAVRAQVAEMEATGLRASLRDPAAREALSPLFRPTDGA